MQRQLVAHGQGVFYFQKEVLEILEMVVEHYAIQSVKSHLEVGLKITFDRDRAMLITFATFAAC